MPETGVESLRSETCVFEAWAGLFNTTRMSECLPRIQARSHLIPEEHVTSPPSLPPPTTEEEDVAGRQVEREGCGIAPHSFFQEKAEVVVPPPPPGKGKGMANNK